MKKERKTLEEYLRETGRNPYEVYRAVRRGELKLVDPNPPKTLAEYLSRLDYSLWLWTGYTILALAVAAALAPQQNLILVAIRYTAGALLVLLLPGYYTVEALYPRPGELTGLEKLALSIAVSLAITPLLGLALNYTPWGIREPSTLAVLAAYTITTGIIAAYRKQKMLEKQLEHKT